MGRKRKEMAANQVTDRAAAKIAQVVIRIQKIFSSALNKLTHNLSPAVWKLLIVVFGIAWGIISVRCITNAFGKDEEKISAPAVHITRTVHADSLALMEHIYEQRKKNANE